MRKWEGRRKETDTSKCSAECSDGAVGVWPRPRGAWVVKRGVISTVSSES